GSWFGLRLMDGDGSRSVITNAFVEYGGASPGFKGTEPANVMLDDYYGEVKARIKNVTSRRSAGYGLYAEEDIHADFETNALTENERGPAHLHPRFLGHVDEASDFDGNEVDAVYLHEASLARERLKWPGIEVPYLVEGNIDLAENTFVQIGPGAEFRFEENKGLSVFRSRLSALGTDDDPIVFTGRKETPGYWRGVRFLDTNSVDNALEHVKISYGGADPTYKGSEPANLMLDDYYGTVRLKLHNTELSHSGRYGMYAEEQAEIDFANNELVANERAAALVHPLVIDSFDDQTSYAAADGDEGRIEVLGEPLDGAEVTWPRLDAHYLVRGDVLVRDDAHLTIEPGVEVAFSEGAGLSVYRARLTANGEEDSPIVFTGARETPGYWKGIHLVDTASVENSFEHVVIEYGGATETFKGAEPANLMLDDYYGLVSTTMNNVTSRHSGAAALHLEPETEIRTDSCATIRAEGDEDVTGESQSLSQACRG
ncbi:MAG: hypothetical protein ACOCV2_12585, partial [Persicimonas sp.]